MKGLPCRLPTMSLTPEIAETRRVVCPNCNRVKVQDVTQEKARCAICGNVWAWKRRRSGLVRLIRRAG